MIAKTSECEWLKFKDKLLFIPPQVENSYSVSVPIFKQFHKNIIGKGGANIKKVSSCLLSVRILTM